MYQGSCLCGQVHVEVSGPIESIIHCHCSKCRKNSGTAYSTNGFVAKQHFAVVAGEAKLGKYETEPGKARFFCSVCASPVYSVSNGSPQYVRLRLGILDSDITERPMSHNFVTSKANWEDLDEHLPHYEQQEPGREKYQA